MELDIIKKQTTWNDAVTSINSNFSKVRQAIVALEVGGGGSGITLAELELYLTSNGYINDITAPMVVNALGFTPVGSIDLAKYALKSDLSGYALKSDVDALKEFFDGVDDQDALINKWHELEDFLEGVKEGDTLLAMVANNDSQIKTLKDSVAELDNDVTVMKGLVGGFDTRITSFEDMFDWVLDEGGNRIAIRAKSNFFSELEVAAGGVGEEANTPVFGTVTAVKVDVGEPIYPDNDGVVDISNALEGVVKEFDLTKYAKKDDLNALAGRVTQVEEKNIEQDNSLNTIKYDLSTIVEWYDKVAKHLDVEGETLHVDLNIATPKEVSAGGVGEEGGGGGSTTLDGLMDVEITEKELDDFQSNSQVIGYDKQTGIWINKVTMYHHKQTQPSAEWKINHGLGKFPNVKIVDTLKQLCLGDVYYVDENNVTIKFGGAESGDAYLD